jgi:hypothetical protein
MPMTDVPDAHAPPAVPDSVALRHLSTGFWVSQAIAVVADLGIAEHLKDGPKTCAELASAVGAHVDALYRLLRGTASVGVFAEDAQGRFVLTPLASLLLVEGPQSWRAAALMSGQAWIWQAWGALAHSVKTGQPAFEHVFGVDFDTYLAQHDEAGNVFQGFMNVATAEEAMAVSPVYDFSGLHRVVDVGGGRGALLAAVLKANPRLRGVLFDAPHVVAGAQSTLETQGVTDRCEVVGGDFFESLPTGGDAYMLKWILVSWDDEQSVTILQNCRHAMGSQGRLLVIERIIPPGNEPFFGKLADLNLLVMYKGRHRTEREYRSLFARAGFELTRIIPTHSPTEFSVIEGIPR